MKKRILALALAGTTAFSVFGAAISANAASVSSTDTKYDVDAYMSYSNVAKTINSAAKENDADTVTYWDTTTNPATNITNGVKTNGSLEAYYFNKYSCKEEYEPQVVYTYSYNGVKYTKDGKSISEDEYVNLSPDEKDGYTKVSDADNTYSYTLTVKNGKAVSLTGTGKKGGNDVPTSAHIVDTSVAGEIRIDIDLNGDGVSDETYVSVDALKDRLGEGKTTTDATFYVPKTGTFQYNGKTYTANGSTTRTEEEFTKLKSVKEYVDATQTQTTAGAVKTEGYIVVNGTKTSYDKDDTNFTAWSFNSDMTGEATVSPYTVSTKIVNGALKAEKVATPTIYAYDFLPTNVTASDANGIAYAWSTKDVDKTVAALNNTALKAETGRGRANVGVRYEVVSNWIDFLDELAINQDNGYKETEDEFIDNYSDMLYKDPIYSSSTGNLIGYNTTDLYNIKGLLKDVYKYSSSASYYNANTSELVYLMQQYDKYIGNYIDKDEVASDDWGDLLLTVLNGASEDNFKKAADYKKYTRQVEDLEDAYKDATTSAQIEKAEKAMYELLNKTPYTASTVSKADLNATIESLYFNVGSAPATYTTAPSTQSNNVDYTNYNYYVATSKVTSGVYEFTTTYSRGYYSLYPMADYASSHKVAVYAGNTGAADYTGSYATEEYEWFWNVYQLATNMNANNKYQGAIDAVNEALESAVDALEVTTTPYATETSAMDEMVEKYAGKIESDYNAGYYAKYTQANAFADVAEGKYQTRIAREIAGVAGEALTYQGTQVTITKNDMKTVQTAIKNGQAALTAIKAEKDYSAAQVNALNKAIAAAQNLVDLYEGSYSTKADDQSVNKVYTALVGDKDQMVKSDLTDAIKGIDDAINYSSVVMGWSKNDAGKWQYGTEEGYLNNGWHKVGATWYYFNADGTAKQSEWFKENDKWYYFNSNCGALCGWGKVDGNWYYFKGDNHMKTGWEKVDGNWYYLASSGKMVTGWTQIDGKWYYFSKESNSLGQMLANTTVDGYKLDANGVWNK